MIEFRSYGPQCFMLYTNEQVVFEALRKDLRLLSTKTYSQTHEGKTVALGVDMLFALNDKGQIKKKVTQARRG